MEATLRDGLAALGLPSPAAPQLLDFARRLLEKNQVMNLTAITEAKDVATLHLLDCAALLTLADFRGKTVVDVGTGAGFPGMVLRILEPDFDLTLLDSLGKRVDWGFPASPASTPGRRSLPGNTGRPTTWPPPALWRRCRC